jgi:2-iminoacetate synthase
MRYIDIVSSLSWEQERTSIYGKNKNDVECALETQSPDIEDFKALVSPAAEPYIEKMALKSRELTLKRFGKTIQLYVPVYLSNICENACVYCGFNCKNTIKRKVLNETEILREIEVIKSYGYEHILLVTGESKMVGFDYLKNAIRLIKPHFSLVSIEVQPLEEGEYKELVDMGLHTVYLYQETYHKNNYKLYHPSGKKSDFYHRLDTYERMGRAGVYKMGLGALLGLEDWRTEAFFIALHLKYLQRTYWKTKFSVSLPRLRPHQGQFNPNVNITDKELIQLLCAYRLFDEDVELSLSTRERQELRDNALPLGVTSLSAGSRTEPGGYANPSSSLKQFETSDNRPPKEIMEMIKQKGYEAVWKDWDMSLQSYA